MWWMGFGFAYECLLGKDPASDPPLEGTFTLTKATASLQPPSALNPMSALQPARARRRSSRSGLFVRPERLASNRRQHGVAKSRLVGRGEPAQRFGRLEEAAHEPLANLTALGRDRENVDAAVSGERPSDHEPTLLQAVRRIDDR